MTAQSLLEICNSYIDDRSTVFVFPSAVAAHYYAQQLCGTLRRPLALERFIAWDEFKEHCLSVHQSKQRPANSLSRILFASYILEENAQSAKSGAPLFMELLPPSYASEYFPFINHISGILPSLNVIMEKSGNANSNSDPYLRDLRILFHRYSAFLADHNLYEPDWVRSPFTDQARHWVLLFPNLVDDWESYAEELKQHQSVQIYTVQDIQVDEPPLGCDTQVHQDHMLQRLHKGLLQFSSWREEIRYVAKLISSLVHRQILHYEDIAISIPALENYAENLRIEFRLRSLPISLRHGMAITDQSGGRLFAHLQDCYQSRFSYRALKKLLTDRSLPWKDPYSIEQLLRFGLEYRCLSGYLQGGKKVDVWMDTFNHLLDEKLKTPFPLVTLKQFYSQLKRDITDIVSAANFQDLRLKLLLFANNHFDRDHMEAGVDKVYARAMEELTRLMETEQYLAMGPSGRAFPLLVTHLKNTTYVHQSETPGVPVYPYRVAAGITPKLHIVMNATQDGASVLVDPAPFLREDRKKVLNFSALDRSKDFFEAYRLAQITLYTAPDRGFTGHTIPHQALISDPIIHSIREAELPTIEDAYVIEESKAHHNGVAPYTTQLEGWHRSQRSFRPYNIRQDLRKTPIDRATLRGALYRRLTTKGESNHISPTDINQFITCPFQWLLTNGLGITEAQLEIETIGQKDIGILYHCILESFFNYIKEQPGKRIYANKVDHYKAVIQDLIKDKISAQRNQEGAFQESVYEMLSDRIREHLFAYLEQNIPSLDECSVIGPEYPLRKHYADLGIYLAGTADLILMDRVEQLIIIDFKTNWVPQKKDLLPDEDRRVSNFQIAAYISMAEEQLQRAVSQASFYSIEQRTNIEVIHPAGPQKKNSKLPVIRSDYTPVLESLDQTLALMVEYLKNGKYPVVDPADRRRCTACPVKAVCRINFSGGEKA